MSHPLTHAAGHPDADASGRLGADPVAHPVADAPSPAATATPAAAEPRGRIRRALRRGVCVLAVVAATFSVLSAVLIVAACLVDDLRIDQDMASATATVTEVTARRAAVEFDTVDGTHVRPQTGVFYPTGLVEGQRVRVEYRRANPSLVRVSGRSWTLAVWPALSVPLVTVPLSALVFAAASPRFHLGVPRVGRPVASRFRVRSGDRAE